MTAHQDTMRPIHLIQTGEALYGTQWHAAIARDLGVSDRSIRRWVAGTSRTPDLSGELLLLIVQREHKLVALRRKLLTAGGAK